MLGPQRNGFSSDAILRQALADVMSLHGTTLGNVQLMDWQSRTLGIAVQRGFRSDFLNAFDCVGMRDASVCARAVRERKAVMVEDVFADPAFRPYRTIAQEAGFRAVLSTPLISSANACLGVLSVHFPDVHRPLPAALKVTQALACAAADGVMQSRRLPLEAAAWECLRALARSKKLLDRPVFKGLGSI